ncbi:Bzz1p [Sporobolomyces koalae]|uniref:Bzz1p n=1 Tax=Sporobolomyces koalae TaxID=500713 RepID=UPI0031819390
MSTTYGAALPDSEVLVHARVTNYLSLLPSFASFLQAHTQEAISHSSKLSSLIGNYRKQTSTQAVERSGGTDSTLERALAAVLEQMDLQAREVGLRADQEAKQVGQVLDQVGTRLELVKRKHHEHYKKLLSERDRTNDQREKSKSTYYSACEQVESCRQKKASAKEGRDLEKATKNYDLAFEEMLQTKNQYLLDIDVSNVAKDKLYNQHLPALHDDYQVLEQSSTVHFVHSIDKMIQVQLESLERLRNSVEQAKQALALVNPQQDQDTFVNRWSATKLAAWEVPPDATFQECQVWHDTDEFSTTPASITYLQNVQLKSTTKLSEVSPAFETKRREIGGLRNLREAYERDWGLGDAVSVIENLFTVTHETTLLEIAQTEHRSQIELINATLGDSASTGLRPHEFKPSSFVTPSTCAVCEGSVWGKGIKCDKCGMAVHAKKCEMKVPAGCTARPGAGVVRHKSKKSPASTNTGANPPPSASMSNLSLNRSTSSGIGSSAPMTSSGSASRPPPRRTVPPPIGGVSSNPTAPPNETLPTAVMAYDYCAATASELTVSEGDSVSIVELQDAAGWTKVRTRDGREGLVPGSYFVEDPSSISVTQSRGQEVVAIYDYTATLDEEISIVQGERAVLVGRGFEYGDGWAQVEIPSRGQGILPASYIQLV